MTFDKLPSTAAANRCRKSTVDSRNGKPCLWYWLRFPNWHINRRAKISKVRSWDYLILVQSLYLNYLICMFSFSFAKQSFETIIQELLWYFIPGLVIQTLPYILHMGCLESSLLFDFSLTAPHSASVRGLAGASTRPYLCAAVLIITV